MTGLNVEPVPNGYASHIKDPQIEDPGKFSWWAGIYASLLLHLKQLVEQGKAQQAFMEIPEALNWAQNYVTNGLNVEVADKSNFDSTVGKYLNAIQEDFDHYASGDKDPKYAQDAQYAKQQIERLIKKYPRYAAAIKADVENQLKAIFDVPSGKSLQEWWSSLWKLPKPSASSSHSSSYHGTSPVSNAINAARNDVESQNTILNSQMQTYAKEASQDLAFMQNCYRSIIEMIKAPVTAAQSASN